MTKPIAKSPTGITGFDEITQGGLPEGRPTLVCGPPGSGKSLFALEFLVRGATQFDEPGVLVSFEESAEEIGRNVASLGFDLDRLVKRKQLAIDHVVIERAQIHETGDYDLEGLFIRIGHAADSVGARRIVIDTLESLFTGFTNQSLIRSELTRLFRFLKHRRLTAVITGESGVGTLTRQGLEEYVSDCVIALDQRVTSQIATRRIRVVKYRGTTHGTNEYPFIIGTRGLSVLPVTSLLLNHQAPTRRVSSGVKALDGMLGGKGYYEGSSVLISGGPGSGKTSFASAFVKSLCDEGKRAVLVTHEESEAQLVRNLRSIGTDLRAHIDAGRLTIHSTRPSLYGLESHLVAVHKLVEDLKPDGLVMDPITSFEGTASDTEISSMLIRMIDFLKVKGITCLLTNLTAKGDPTSNALISSLMDTWIVLYHDLAAGRRARYVDIIKSRGMSHDAGVREFTLSNRGIQLVAADERLSRPAVTAESGV